MEIMAGLQNLLPKKGDRHFFFKYQSPSYPFKLNCLGAKGRSRTKRE
jgi:hypothetical protein